MVVLANWSNRGLGSQFAIGRDLAFFPERSTGSDDAVFGAEFSSYAGSILSLAIAAVIGQCATRRGRSSTTNDPTAPWMDRDLAVAYKAVLAIVRGVTGLAGT